MKRHIMQIVCIQKQVKQISRALSPQRMAFYNITNNSAVRSNDLKYVHVQ